MAALYTSINMDMQDLPLDDGLLAQAFLASVLVPYHLPLALAIRADSLKALDHWPHLAHHSLCTRTPASCACSNGTFFATSTIAGRTDDGFLERQFRHLALVDVFQRYFMDVMDCSSFLRTGVTHPAAKHTSKGPTTATKELREQILGIHSSAARPLFKTLLTILVIKLSLLRICQHFVSLGDFFELFRSLRVARVLIYSTVLAGSLRDLYRGYDAVPGWCFRAPFL